MRNFSIGYITNTERSQQKSRTCVCCQHWKMYSCCDHAAHAHSHTHKGEPWEEATFFMTQRPFVWKMPLAASHLRLLVVEKRTTFDEFTQNSMYGQHMFLFHWMRKWVYLSLTSNFQALRGIMTERWAEETCQNRLYDWYSQNREWEREREEILCCFFFFFRVISPGDVWREIPTVSFSNSNSNVLCWHVHEIFNPDYITFFNTLLNNYSFIFMFFLCSFTDFFLGCHICLIMVTQAVLS